MHVKSGYAWTDQLEREAKVCQRSALRGIGPAHQSAGLPATRLHELSFLTIHSVAGFVVGFINLAVVSMLFSS